MNISEPAFSKPSEKRIRANEVRQEIKEQLIKHMVVVGDQYKIEISADEWHKIFKTK